MWHPPPPPPGCTNTCLPGYTQKAYPDCSCVSPPKCRDSNGNPITSTKDCEAKFGPGYKYYPGLYSVNPSCCEICTVNTVSSKTTPCTACSGETCQALEEKTFEYTPPPGLTVKQCCDANPGKCGSPPNYRWKSSTLVNTHGTVDKSEVDACEYVAGTGAFSGGTCDCTSSTSGGLLWRYVKNLTATPPSCDGECVCDSTKQCCDGDRVKTTAADCSSGETLRPYPNCTCAQCVPTTTQTTATVETFWDEKGINQLPAEPTSSDTCSTIKYRKKIETTTTETTTACPSPLCNSSNCTVGNSTTTTTTQWSDHSVTAAVVQSDECAKKGGSWKVINGSDDCECQDEKNWEYNNTINDIPGGLKACSGKCYCDSRTQCCSDASAVDYDPVTFPAGEVINTTQDCQKQFGTNFVFDSNAKDLPSPNCQCVEYCCDASGNITFDRTKCDATYTYDSTSISCSLTPVYCCDASGNVINDAGNSPSLCDSTNTYTYDASSNSCKKYCCNSSCQKINDAGNSPSQCDSSITLNTTTDICEKFCCDASGNKINSCNSSTPCDATNTYTYDSTTDSCITTPPPPCPPTPAGQCCKNNILITNPACNDSGKVVAAPGGTKYTIDTTKNPCECNCKATAGQCCVNNVLYMDPGCDKCGKLIDDTGNNPSKKDTVNHTFNASSCSCALNTLLCRDSKCGIFTDHSDCPNGYYFDKNAPECCKLCNCRDTSTTYDVPESDVCKGIAYKTDATTGKVCDDISCCTDSDNDNVCDNMVNIANLTGTKGVSMQSVCIGSVGIWTTPSLPASKFVNVTQANTYANSIKSNCSCQNSNKTFSYDVLTCTGVGCQACTVVGTPTVSPTSPYDDCPEKVIQVKTTTNYSCGGDKTICPSGSAPVTGITGVDCQKIETRDHTIGAGESKAASGVSKSAACTAPTSGGTWVGTDANNGSCTCPVAKPVWRYVGYQASDLANSCKGGCQVCTAVAGAPTVSPQPLYPDCPGEKIKIDTAIATNYNCGGDNSLCPSGTTPVTGTPGLDCKETTITSRDHTIGAGESNATGSGVKSKQKACEDTAGTGKWNAGTETCTCPSDKPIWSYEDYDSTDLANSCKGGCQACTVVGTPTVSPTSPYDDCPEKVIQVKTTTNYSCGGDKTICPSGSAPVTGITGVDCQKIETRDHTIGAGESKAASGVSKSAACTAPTSGGTWNAATGCACPVAKPVWRYVGYQASDLANSCIGGCGVCTTSVSAPTVSPQPLYPDCPGEKIKIDTSITTNYNCGGDNSLCPSGTTPVTGTPGLDCTETTTTSRDHTIAETGESNATGSGVKSKQKACEDTAGTGKWNAGTETCTCPSDKPIWSYEDYDSTDLANSCKGGCQACTLVGTSTVSPQPLYPDCPGETIQITTTTNYNCGGNGSPAVCSSLCTGVNNCTATQTGNDCQTKVTRDHKIAETGESNATGSGVKSKQKACEDTAGSSNWSVATETCTCPSAKPHWSYQDYDSTDLANSCKGGCSCDKETICQSTSNATLTGVPQYSRGSWNSTSADCDCSGDENHGNNLIDWSFTRNSTTCSGECKCNPLVTEKNQCDAISNTLWDLTETPPTCVKGHCTWEIKDACNFGFSSPSGFCDKTKICGVARTEQDCQCKTAGGNAYPTSKEQCDANSEGSWNSGTSKCVHNTNTNFYWTDPYDDCYDFHCDTTCYLSVRRDTIYCRLRVRVRSRANMLRQ